jgi:hypothetical protein
LKNDIIILNLLIGWEIIHIAKTGKKLSVRLREFPGKHSRFFRLTFNKCSVATIVDFVSAKTEDIACFNFIGCMFSRIEMEGDGMISIQLLKHSEFVGSLKIVSQEIGYDFTTK